MTIQEYLKGLKNFQDSLNGITLNNYKSELNKIFDFGIENGKIFYGDIQNNNAPHWNLYHTKVEKYPSIENESNANKQSELEFVISEVETDLGIIISYITKSN